MRYMVWVDVEGRKTEERKGGSVTVD